MMSANLPANVRVTQRQLKRPGQAVIASLLAGLVLFLNLLSASPTLHQWFHADAGKSEHQCAVTLFAHSQIDSASVDTVVSMALTVFAPVPAVDISLFHPAIDGLPAGRAPPVPSSLG